MFSFESDDLLIRSQMLISKFRKQREIALSQQNQKAYPPVYENKYGNCLNINHKIQSEYDTYPGKEKDNVLLKKFISQNKNTQSMENNHSIPSNYFLPDTCRKEGSVSSGESSIWSTCSSTHKIIEKADFGMMTESERNIQKDHEDVMTPVTTLREPREENNRNVIKNSTLHISPTKVFSSVCTQYQPKLENFPKTEMAKTFCEEKIIHDYDDFVCESNEEDQMKAAWEYFQEEKMLEKRIAQQVEMVDNLTKQMEGLKVKKEQESLILEMMYKDKEKFRTRRYGIFTGLSREIKSNTKEDCREMNLLNCWKDQNNVSARDFIQDQRSETTTIDNEDQHVSTLNSETVRNIVNKIISKEFSNSDDHIFNKIKTSSKMPKVNLRNTVSNENEEECILSDVMSVKDLKISSSCMDNDTKTSTTGATSSMSIFNKVMESKPPKIKRRLRPAHSADNIFQMREDIKVKPRKNARSPSISGQLKQLLYSSSSSSEDSMFDSTIQTRQ